jgi:glucokinase
MLLAGDVGGTKTALALFDHAHGPHEPVEQAAFPSSQYPSLEELIQEFLSQIDERPSAAYIGVAGPVVQGRASVTNLSWEIEEAHLTETLPFERVQLINDLEAIASAIPLLEADDLHTLNDREPQPGGAIAVVAPGTGLGEAYLTWNGSQYEAQPSEGGHTDFAPANELQIGLLRYLQEIHGHVSWERVCSGMGIPNIYTYLKASGAASEPPWLAEKLSKAADATPIIVNHALKSEKPCSLCVQTVDTFVAVLGAEAGNMALKTLATGGVYLGGGIPPRILPVLRAGRFMDAFRDKGRFEEFMDRLPVHVILNSQAALLGAAGYGLRKESQ